MPFWPQSYADPARLLLAGDRVGNAASCRLFVALVMVIVFAVVQRQTVLGFQSSVFGANPGAAAYAGFRVKTSPLWSWRFPAGSPASLVPSRPAEYISGSQKYGRGFRSCGHRGCADRPARTGRYPVGGVLVRNLLRRSRRAATRTGAALSAGLDHRSRRHLRGSGVHWALPEPKGGRLMDALFITGILAADITARHGDRAVGDRRIRRGTLGRLQHRHRRHHAVGGVRRGLGLGTHRIAVARRSLRHDHRSSPRQLSCLMVLVLRIDQFVSGIGMVIFGSAFPASLLG